MGGTSGRPLCSELRPPSIGRDPAQDVRRIGPGFFVQTPYKHFSTVGRAMALEPAAWWPFYGRCADFNLLSIRDMQLCRPDAEFHRQSVFGPAGSIMAVPRI